MAIRALQHVLGSLRVVLSVVVAPKCRRSSRVRYAASVAEEPGADRGPLLGDLMHTLSTLGRFDVAHQLLGMCGCCGCACACVDVCV